MTWAGRFGDMYWTFGQHIIWFQHVHGFKMSSVVGDMGDRGHNRHLPKRGGAAVPLSRGAGTPSNTM